jgi:hypothetical protein
MVLLAKIGLGVASAAIAGAGLLCSEGFVSVKVDERGRDPHHIRIVAPALLVPAAAYVASRQIHVDREMRDIKEWLPTAQAAADALSATDDVTLVEIDDRNEHVRVAKRSNDIVVDVDATDAAVHVSVPLRAVNSTLNALVLR